MSGDCYPNILSDFIPIFIPKIRKDRKKENQISTLSLCKYFCLIYLAKFFRVL